MANTGIAEVAATIETVVSAMVTKTLIQKSVALAIPGIWDRSGEVGPGMDQLDMIELAELTEQTVDETGAPMTPQTINPTASPLNLDQHKSIPFAVTKRGTLQSKIALVQKTIENGVKTLAYAVDNYIFGVAVAAAGTTVTVAAADGLTALRAMGEQFDAHNVPTEERAAVIGSQFMWQELLATNNVIRANEFGSAQAIRMAEIANIYGISLFRSNSANVPVDGFIGIGLEAMAFARQRALDFESQVQVLSQKTDYTLTHLFGSGSTKASANPRIYVYNPV